MVLGTSLRHSVSRSYAFREPVPGPHALAHKGSCSNFLRRTRGRAGPGEVETGVRIARRDSPY